MRHELKWILCVIIGISLGGCGMDYQCKISSNTTWSATFADQTISGYKNRVFGLTGNRPICVVAKKGTENGYLMMQLFKEGGWIFYSDTRNNPVTTTEPFGIVSDCID